MRPVFCEDAIPVFFNLLDFSIAPPLFYYTYVPTVILTFLLAFVALYYNRFDTNSKHFAALAIALGLLVVFSFFQWIAAPITLVMFSWQLWSLLFSLLFLATFLFLYVFIFDRPVSDYIYLASFVLLLPIIFLTPTYLNIEWFDLYWCEVIQHGA